MGTNVTSVLIPDLVRRTGFNNIRLGKIRNNNISIISYYNSNNKEFISLKECSEYFNICPKTIKNNINGKTEKRFIRFRKHLGKKYK